jgi:4'-phosphopantetheinyl transferase
MLDMTMPENVWKQPPEQLILPHGEAHIWLAFLDQPSAILEYLAYTLSSDEDTRAQRYRFAVDSNRFIARRGILRVILGHYLALAPYQLQFYYGIHGKPKLTQDCGGHSLRFNVSHSYGLALYAVTRDREVGIDIECRRSIPEATDIADKLFSTSESLTLRSAPSSGQEEVFLKYWTFKEAYLKAHGIGLPNFKVAELVPLDIDKFTTQEFRQLPEFEEGTLKNRVWSLRQLESPIGFVASVVVEGNGCDLRCWRWM